MRTLRWSGQGPGERVLRGWLGATFLYAGLHKLTDPGFLQEGSDTYIGAQLEGYAQISPLRPLLELLADVPVAAGLGVAVAEILIGVATLVGVAPALAASAGFGLSITLWLASTWTVTPYFLGSNTIYAVAWLAYLLALPSTHEALDRLRTRRRGAGAAGDGPAEAGAPAAGGAVTVESAADEGVPDEGAATDGGRRRLLRGGAVLVGGLVIGGLAAVVGRVRRTDPAAADTGGGGGAELTTAETLAEQGAVDFDDPDEGAAVLVGLAGGEAVAFSLRCTHSGCTAAYDRGTGLIVCPCHASRFDPAGGGRAVAGPATAPLTQIPVTVDPATGTVRRA